MLITQLKAKETITSLTAGKKVDVVSMFVRWNCLHCIL